jgi:hypothetical protein
MYGCTKKPRVYGACELKSRYARGLACVTFSTCQCIEVDMCCAILMWVRAGISHAKPCRPGLKNELHSQSVLVEHKLGMY